MTLNFVRMAYAYDRTRYHPPEVSGRIATSIIAPVEESFPEPLFLELGVGTGRVAVPIVARGHRFVGVDVNPAMLEVMRYKIAGVGRKVKLIEADARELPFERGSFQAVIAVHFWHLVNDWQRILLETFRVLAPGGYLFEGWDAAAGESEDWRIQEQWRAILADLGFELERGRHQRRLAEVRSAMEKIGLEPLEEKVAEWVEERTPRQSLEILGERLYSFTWAVPEDLFHASLDRLWSWARDAYPDLDHSYPIRWNFVLRRTRMPE